MSEDWFARSLLESTIRESELFSHIIATEDGYTAIAEAWQCVEDGVVPDIILADGAISVMTASQLLRSVRENAETEGIFFAVLTEFASEPDQEPQDFEGADLTSPCSAGCTDLTELIQELAFRAANSVRGEWRPASGDIWRRE